MLNERWVNKFGCCSKGCEEGHVNYNGKHWQTEALPAGPATGT